MKRKKQTYVYDCACSAEEIGDKYNRLQSIFEKIYQ